MRAMWNILLGVGVVLHKLRAGGESDVELVKPYSDWKKALGPD